MPRSINAVFDNKYPWCDLHVEVAFTYGNNFMFNGNLVSVLATSGIGGFHGIPAMSRTSYSYNKQTIVIDGRGIIYCGITYNGNYYGNSGMVKIEGYLDSRGDGALSGWSLGQTPFLY